MNISKEEISKLAVTVACSFGLLLVIYNVVESVRYNGFFYPSRKKRESEAKDKLEYCLELLDGRALDRPRLMIVLDTLLEFSVFTEAQNKINDLGYLPEIINMLGHSDRDVRQKTVILVNNLALNEGNQVILRECIPQLIDILSTNEIQLSSIELFTAVLGALTNLTTLDESHGYLLPKIHVLYNILHDCEVVQIKLQVLKVLVNISTNQKICENMFDLDAQLLKCSEPYINSDVCEALILRAVSCYANVLNSLHRRWKYGAQPTITTPEFISDKVHDKLIELCAHGHEDIRFQANRCIAALQTPSSAPSLNLDQVDILEILKL